MADYRNYLGLAMPTNGPSARSQWGTGGPDTLVGGGVDDIFYIYSSAETVVESPGAMATVDVMTWSPYTLPANVTNMTVSGAPGTVVGNALDNLIIAQGTSNMTIDGGGGNDVLVANAGTDTFVAGSGQDVIYGFDTTKDMVRLPASGLSSFAALQPYMTQVGQDVLIALPSGSGVTLRGTSLGQLSANNFELSIDTSKLTETFDDEFNTFSSSPDGSSGRWMTSYDYGNRTLSANHEAEYYSDSSTGVNPFSVSNGVLTITAAPAQAGQTPAGSGLTYTSGAIDTFKSFSQLYGYFEMRAQLPAGQGFWPAFWLLPANGAWPPELDVMEQIGGSTTYQTSHTDQGGFDTTQGFATQVATATSAFHTYGVDWEPDTITWYIDGTAVAKTATPSDMHTPMYMLLNLAVGASGSWPGAADGTSSAQYKIDYVRAYGSTEAAAAAAATPAPPPTVTLATEVLASDTGASASDRITSNGAVTLTGTVTGASGTAVTIDDGTTVLGVATVAANGTWTYATTLSSGTHALHAVATDPTGVTASSATAASITVLTAPPTVSIAATKTAPSGAVTLQGTVSGPAGTLVTLSAGQTSLGPATLTSTGAWSYSGVLPSGATTITATATDLAGNTGSAGTLVTIPSKSTADLLVLQLSEDTTHNDVKFTVSVDGKQVGGPTAVDASHAAGAHDLFAFAGNFGSGPHNVAVTVTNPGSGRVLHVETLTLDGSTTVENAVQSGAGAAHYLATASGTGALSVGTSQTLDLDKSLGAADVAITGSNATILYESAPSTGSTVSGFAPGDTFDFRSLAFHGQTNGATIGAGVLSVGEGAASVRLGLVGSYAASDIVIAADGQGGTAVTLLRH